MSDIFWEDGDGYLAFKTDKEGIVWAHSKVYNWNRQIYYKAKAVWKEALEELNKKGIEYVCVTIPNNDPKLEKFEKMFGFEELKNIDVPNFKLFYCETGL